VGRSLVLVELLVELGDELVDIELGRSEGDALLAVSLTDEKLHNHPRWPENEGQLIRP
jgi:hypothetical protein